MKEWLSGVRGIVLMIIVWVIGWGLGFGGIVEAFIDPDGKIQDVWPTVLAIPGLVGGIIFSALLMIAERGRSFDEVSLVRASTWGVVTGIVIGLLTIPAKVGDVSPGAVGMTALATALSLVAAIGSILFFRLLAWWSRGRVAV